MPWLKGTFHPDLPLLSSYLLEVGVLCIWTYAEALRLRQTHETCATSLPYQTLRRTQQQHAGRRRHTRPADSASPSTRVRQRVASLYSTPTIFFTSRPLPPRPLSLYLSESLYTSCSLARASTPASKSVSVPSAPPSGHFDLLATPPLLAPPRAIPNPLGGVVVSPHLVSPCHPGTTARAKACVACRSLWYLAHTPEAGTYTRLHISTGTSTLITESLPPSFALY